MTDSLWIFDLDADECDGILMSENCDEEHSIEEQMIMCFIREGHTELLYHIHFYAKQGFDLFKCIVKGVCEALEEKDEEIIRCVLGGEGKGTG